MSFYKTYLLPPLLCLSLVACGGGSGGSSSNGSAPVNADAELGQAKAAVSDIADLSNSIQLIDVDTYVEEQDDFASPLLDADLDAIVQAMNKAGDAVARAYDAFSEDNNLSDFTYEGIAVTIFGSPSTKQFRVNQQVPVERDGVTTQVVVDLVATDMASTYSIVGESIANSDGSVTDRATVSANIDLSLRGEARVEDSVEVGISDAQVRYVYSTVLDETETSVVLVGGQEEITHLMSSDSNVDEMEYRLQVVIRQLSGVSSLRFDGEFFVRVDDYIVDSESLFEYFYDEEGYLDNWNSQFSSQINVGSASYQLSGTFTQGQESLSAYISAEAAQLNQEEVCDGGFDCGSLPVTFVNAALEFGLDIDLEGLGKTASVFRIERDSSALDRTRFVLELSHDDFAFDINLLVLEDRSELNIVASDGVEINLAYDQTTELVTGGSILVNGREYADIGYREGILLVTYSDGSFESFGQ